MSYVPYLYIIFGCSHNCKLLYSNSLRENQQPCTKWKMTLYFFGVYLMTDFEIKRAPEHGGNMTFKTFEELKDAFKKQVK